MPFVHSIDPIIASPGGIHLWWYGLSYTLGFLELHLCLRRWRERLSLSLNQVYSLTLFFSVGVLLGGRVVEVLFYEWAYYSRNPLHIGFYWLGGMATHGLLIGAVTGTWLFCRRHRRSFLEIADALVIPGAFLLAIGRVGNFIDGQIVGAVTTVPWGVQFPDAEGFRHPVVLYDGLKNLAIIPLLLWVRSRQPARGMVTAHFIFWYAFLRLGVDLFREYRMDWFDIGVGQGLNLVMAVTGLVMIFALSIRSVKVGQGVSPSRGAVTSSRLTGEPEIHRVAAAQRDASPYLAVFALVLLFSLTIPSDWTQDIVGRYSERHPGLVHSWAYPQLEGNE